MEEMTLERELNIRINQHKMSMLMAQLAKKYIDNQRADKGVTLPEPIIEEQAIKVAQQATQYIMLAGQLNQAYDEAWETLKDVIPDNYCTLQ